MLAPARQSGCRLGAGVLRLLACCGAAGEAQPRRLLFFHPVPLALPDGAAPEIAPAIPDQLRGARDFLMKRSSGHGGWERFVYVNVAA